MAVWRAGTDSHLDLPSSPAVRNDEEPKGRVQKCLLCNLADFSIKWSLGSRKSIKLVEAIFSIQFFQLLCFPVLKLGQFCPLRPRWVRGVNFNEQVRPVIYRGNIYEPFPKTVIEPMAPYRWTEIGLLSLRGHLRLHLLLGHHLAGHAPVSLVSSHRYIERNNCTLELAI